MRALIVGCSLLFACSTGPEAPGPLEAGIARVRMPAPVGIGTAGYGGLGVAGNPSPYADIYPGTERIHGHPEFKAVVLSRGDGHELVFVRSDTVGVFQQFRRAIVEELRDRLGKDLDDELILGATHTHSGPGRVVDAGGPFVLIADTFFPEFYLRMVEAVADVVEEAYADLQPARLGHTVAWPADAHSDRRCEDGLDYRNSAAPVLVVERGEQVEALVASFAIHGTVLDIEDYTLSQDVHGAIEEAVEDGFDHPVEVLLFNSWGADMAPEGPAVAGTGAPQPAGYDKMDAIGITVSDEVHLALADVAWSDGPALDMQTHRFRIDREHIGYADGVFPYPYGGVFCGASNEADCDPSTTEDGIDQQCIGFTEDFPAPDQTVMSVGRVGDWHFVTWPGEPGTLLAEDVMARIARHEGVQSVMFFGYTQDYIGYAIAEEDWWQGGYEASGALWGPRQGEYLRDRLLEAFDITHLGLDHLRRLEVPPVAPFDVHVDTPLEPPDALDAGTIVDDVAGPCGPTDVVAFTVGGFDPWLGPPVAQLQRSDGTPVTRPNGVPVDSDGYRFWVDLTADPSWGQALNADERAFHWRFHLPVSHAAGGDPLAGTYRLVVTLPDGTEVVSSVFEVAE